MTHSLYTSDQARSLARLRLPRIVFDYIDGAAGRETAASLNLSELDKLRLIPRVLSPSHRHTVEKTFLGMAMGLPFGIAPMGMCNLAWPGADRMLANESARRGIPIAVSTASSTTLETMYAHSKGTAWFQLYVSGTTESALALANRAARTGYEVLILTVDVPMVAPRPRDLRNGFGMPLQIGARQFFDFAFHPQWSITTIMAGAPAPANFQTGAAGSFDRNASRAGANWDFLSRLREEWKGKLIVKGVLCAEDAQRIKAAGVDAIYVSNHGGRQLDSAVPAITALGSVRQAVGPHFPLIFDSGIRSGEDVIKALAAGADFVMLGRPLLYAIAAAKLMGLQSFLDHLTNELSVALSQLGLESVNQLGRANLAADCANRLCP